MNLQDLNSWLLQCSDSERAALSSSVIGILDRTRLGGYKPYPKQTEFHRAPERERMLIAANQVGKTWAAGMEMAMHLTGLYPEWWEGLEFARPNHWLAGSESGELTRRGVQRILFGRDPKSEIGTGCIPADRITGITWAHGVPELIDTASIRFKDGKKNSTVSLKSYDQGRSKWQADTVDGVWFDEEPPLDVYTEGLTRTNNVLGPIMLTLTPLKGMSDVVGRYLMERVGGTSYITMTIDDAEHYTTEQRAAIIASYPVHEREARTKGIPSAGSGRIFPFAEESIMVKAFALPEHWPRICGIDFGWDHPSAAVWLAWDRDGDKLVIYDTYRAHNTTPAVQAVAIQQRGKWIPIAWPADGLQTEKGTGKQLMRYYREAGCNMLPEHAQYPVGQDTSESSRTSVEAGIMDLYQYMESGRFVVFEHLTEWLEEFRLYHRDENGKIVKIRDDLISATRYAKMMLRYSKVAALKRPSIPIIRPADPVMGY